jgi:SSS family solute:Na+ symporter
MTTSADRKLDAFSLAALLVSAHYGLGFLLGTAEEASISGAAGSLYAVSLSLGTIALLALAKLYWIEIDQIWTLLGKQYGNLVKVLVAVMAWSALIGIEAVQIISGSAILHILHIPTVPSMVGLVFLASILSLQSMERASHLFQALLLMNILTLVYVLCTLHSLPLYLRSPLEFLPSLEHHHPLDAIGISLSTIFLVLIDMKCQQFLVQTKDLRSVYQGCLLAAFLLFVLAFLPSAVVIAAQNSGILPADLDGKDAIPYLLSWVGGGSDRPLGMVFILSLLVPALGVGSSVLRVQTKTILDLELLPTTETNRMVIVAINAALGLAVALRGGPIIGLIMKFYAAYIAAVWVPFAAYLLGRAKWYVFCSSSVRLALVMGSLSALSTLALILILPGVAVRGSAELTITLTGIVFGLLGLLTGQAIEQYSSWLKPKEER